MLRLIRQIMDKKKWMPAVESGIAKPTVDGKLVLRVGKTDKQITVRPDVFLFRQFGAAFYPVREVILVGGQTRNFNLNGNLIYSASFTDGTQGVNQVILGNNW